MRVVMPGRQNAFIARRHLEVVVLATLFGLAAPFFFLAFNKGSVHLGEWLFYLILGIIGFVGLGLIWANTQIIRTRPSEWIIQALLIVWGSTMLAMIAMLIRVTGGIESSVFGWLFEHALVVTATVRPKHKAIGMRRLDGLWREFRPVILTLAIEVGLILLLYYRPFGFLHPVPMGTIRPNIGFWGSGALIASIVAGSLAFLIASQRFEPELPAS